MQASRALPDVAIIGGGIIGTATAAALASAGARVTLYERGPAVASGASGRNAGEICQPPDPVLAQLFRESLARYRELDGERLGADEVFRVPMSPIGFLEVAFDGDLVRRVAASLARIQPELPPELLDGADLRACEPLLADGLTAYRVDTGFPVRPADATRAFASLATRSGATIRTGADARVWCDDGVARGVEINGERLAAGWVVVAAGPWTPELVDPTGAWRPIRSLWGVIVEMHAPAAPRQVIGELLNDDSAMLAADLSQPMLGVNPAPAPAVADGAAAPFGLGGTLAAVEPDPVRVAPTLVEHARRFLPSLDPRQMGAVRLCARPASADARPLIGFARGIERLVVAAGNGAWGISTGPATARLAADVVLSGSDAGVPPELRAGRFDQTTS